MISPISFTLRGIHIQVNLNSISEIQLHRLGLTPQQIAGTAGKVFLREEDGTYRIAEKEYKFFLEVIKKQNELIVTKVEPLDYVIEGLIVEKL